MKEKVLNDIQIRSLVVCVLALLISVQSPAVIIKRADNFEYGGIYYEKISDGTVWVTNKSKGGGSQDINYQGDIVIPGHFTYKEVSYTVTGFGDAFQGSDISTITIPSTIERFYNNPFQNCTNLSTIIVEKSNPTYDSRNNCNAIIETKTNCLIAGCKNTVVPNGVTCIGSNAFQGCNILSIDIPNSVTTILEYAFSGCKNLTSFLMPNSVMFVGFGAFKDCTNLTSIRMSDSLTLINEEMFLCCSSLESITIPNAVTSIGESAFYECTALSSIDIPNSVVSIGGSAFNGTAWYNNQPDGLIYAGQVVYKYKGDMPSNTSLSIEEGTKGIAGSAFSGREGLISIKIPQSVVSIGDNAFWGTAWFDNLPDGLVYLGKVLYCYKGNVPENTDIIIEKGTVEITGRAFSGKKLSSITIPGSVLFIGRLAFEYCSLNSIVIPRGVVSIGTYAFSGSKLRHIQIPNTVKSIGYHGFSMMNNDSLQIVSEIEEPFPIENQIFGSTGVTLTVPAGTKSVYQETAGWSQFQNIVEASGKDKDIITFADAEVKRICVENWDTNGDGELSKTEAAAVTILNQFWSNDKIKSFNELEYFINLKTICDFYGCKNLVSIAIPNSVERIIEDSFRGCNSLNAVYITDLAAWCNITFNDLGLIGAMTSNPLEHAHHLFLNGAEVKDLIIPNNATSIGNFAFYGCSNLISVTIPNSVTSIGENAFSGCNGLTAVHISDLEAWCKISFNDSNPLMYAHHLFLNGEEITELNIPKSITRIKSHSFNGCHGLTSVTIPDNVTSIGDYAFANCNNLTSVILEIKNPFAIGGTIFSSTENDKDIYAIATLVVPAGTKSLYQSTAGWNKFQNIVEVSEIGQIFESDGIYYRIGENNTVSVTSGDTKYSGDIVIPSQVSYMNKIYDVTSIGDWAFGYCYSLTSVEIPNSVKSIGFGAFNTCRKLKSITIPSSVINIGYEGFCDCMGLTSVHIMDLEAWCKISFSYEDSQPLKCAEHLYLDGVEVKDLVIPNSITSIGGWSFLGCKGLVSVTIPNSVASIGNSAFRGCSGLTSIVSEIKNPFEISDDVFLSYDKDIYATVTLTVPKGTKSLYQSTAGWNKFQNIVEASGVGTEFEADGIRYKMCENNSVSVIQRSNRSSYGDVVIPSHVSYDGFNYIVTAIDDYAFCSCDIGGKMYYEDLIMTSITIPSTIKSIGVDAFADRMGLNAVYITDLDAWCNIQFHGEDSNPLYYAHHLFLNGIEIKDLVIPNSVTSISDGAFMGSSFTSITIPASVTRIGSYAFKECSGLNAVNITDLEAWFNISFESNPLYHAHHLFLNGTEITELIVPKSISRIGSKSFQGCSGLTSVTIPNNITGIEDYAFSYCNGLTSIILEIKNPFSIDESTFLSRESEKDIYTSATLVVPAGTKSLYQSTAGWNKFQNIVEEGTENSTFEANGISYFGTASTLTAVVQSVNSEKKDVVIPESVYYGGKTYQVTAVADNAFSGLDVNYISLPASVTSVTDKTFSRCNMGALIWNAETTLPGNTFSNASMGTDANFLLYVKSASNAPSTVKNVVANGIASSVLLSDDGGKFYCPEQFKANSISYTHYYNMETGGNGKGWETIALPFDVQKISHSTRGEIIPFAAYRSGSSQKPFWLANFTGSGFKRTSAILANEPYIIAMPNSSNYNNEYNLAGGVTFSSENIVIPKTPTFSGTFLPAFDVVSKSSSVMALNVRNRNVSYTGSDDAGSRFISDLREVRPYEAYMVSSTRGVYVINADNGTTDLEGMLFFADKYSEITIHTLSGQLVGRTNQRDFDKIWNGLSKGVYIVNGKKLIK